MRRRSYAMSVAATFDVSLLWRRRVLMELELVRGGVRAGARTCGWWVEVMLRRLTSGWNSSGVYVVEAWALVDVKEEAVTESWRVARV